MSASATQAFSTIFILLEITGMAVYLPSLMAAMIAVLISKRLYLSVYDSIIKLRGWPAMLEAQTDNDSLTVRDIMHHVENLVVIQETTTIEELDETLHSGKALPKTFPVVNNRNDMYLLGTISLGRLQELYSIKKDVKDSQLPRDQSLYGVWETGNQEEKYTTNNVEMKEASNAANVSEKITINYVTCPVAISEDTPALVAHLLFSQVRMDDIFVLWMGRLIGQLHKEVLVSRVSKENDED